MELLLEISDQDFDKSKIVDVRKDYEIRRASRAVLFDDDLNVALLSVSKEGYYELPGGGVEAGEDLETALRREVMEEVGAEIGEIEELGMIIEYRDKWKIFQISYCYTTRVSKLLGTQEFTQDEIDEGFELKWFEINEALDKIKPDKSKSYDVGFVQKRDYELLVRAASIIQLSQTLGL